MFRFKSRLATQDRLHLFPVGVPGTTKLAIYPPPKDYEGKFSLMADRGDFNTFKAPRFSTNVGIALRFDAEHYCNRLPDIWGVENHLVCSELFKSALQQIDSEFVDFSPLLILDYEGNPLKLKSDYYWLNLRRFVKAKKKYVPLNDQYFYPTSDETEQLGALIKDKKILEELRGYPVWRILGADPLKSRLSGSLPVFYISADALKVFQSYSVSGLNIYSKKYGLNEESVCGLGCWGGDNDLSV